MTTSSNFKRNEEDGNRWGGNWTARYGGRTEEEGGGFRLAEVLDLFNERKTQSKGIGNSVFYTRSDD